MTSKDFDKLLDKYFEKFGKNYPLVITSQLSFEEHAKRIHECINAGKEAPEPHYKEGALY